MSLATLNGTPVTSGRLTFRLEGEWVAELTLQGGTAVDGPAAVLEVGGVPLIGTASSAEDEGGRVTVTVTAGAAGLEAPVDPLHYVPPVTRRTVALAALGLGGETLSPLASPVVLDAALPQWMRVRGTVREAMRRLLKGVASWRHLPDGTVWVGEETWAPFTGPAVVESEEPTQRLITVAVESLAILPGVTYLGQRISQAEYTLDGATLRARLRWGEDVSPMRAMVREETASQDYAAPYVATVVGQNADGTLELRSGDARLANPSRIPIRPGLPGVVDCRVPVGSVAIVEFENADPGRLVVTGWLSGSATRLAIDAEVVLGGGLSVVTRAAVAELVKAELDKVSAIFNTHTHSGGTIGGITGTPQTAYTAGDVAAQRVRLQ